MSSVCTSEGLHIFTYFNLDIFIKIIIIKTKEDGAITSCVCDGGL